MSDLGSLSNRSYCLHTGHLACLNTFTCWHAWHIIILCAPYMLSVRSTNLISWWLCQRSYSHCVGGENWGDRGVAGLLPRPDPFQNRVHSHSCWECCQTKTLSTVFGDCHQLKKAGSLKVMLSARIMLSTPSDWSDTVKGLASCISFPELP